MARDCLGRVSHLDSYNPKRFFDGILPYTVNYDKTELQEWDITGLRESHPDRNDACLCGKHIVYGCQIVNRITAALSDRLSVLWVGSECINRFGIKRDCKECGKKFGNGFTKNWICKDCTRKHKEEDRQQKELEKLEKKRQKIEQKLQKERDILCKLTYGKGDFQISFKDILETPEYETLAKNLLTRGVSGNATKFKRYAMLCGKELPDADLFNSIKHERRSIAYTLEKIQKKKRDEISEKIHQEYAERDAKLRKAAMLLELGNQPLKIKGKHYMQKLSDVSKDLEYCQSLMNWSTKFLDGRDFAVRKSHNLLEKYLRRTGLLVIEEVEV